MLFHAKIGILGKNLYVSHTLFILYLKGNHTLFGEKLYFIWKFNSGNTGMYECFLVFHTVCKVVRVIRQPRGNMLLVGIGGSGRQSLTRLASFICEYTTFQIEVTKHYRRTEFRDGKCRYLFAHLTIKSTFCDYSTSFGHDLFTCCSYIDLLVGCGVLYSFQV